MANDYTSQEEWFCPKCGFRNVGGRNCIHCFADNPLLQNKIVSVPEPVLSYCSRCGNKLDPAARFCSQCAFPAQYPPQSQPVSPPPPQTKDAGVLLSLGIFFMPYIFSWLTLQQGYSSRTRLVAFGWLGFVLLLLFPNKFSYRDSEHSTPSSKAALTQSPSPSASPNNLSENDSKNGGEVPMGIAVNNLRKKISSISATKYMFSKVEMGEAPGVLRVYVKNLWFEAEKHQRRQLTSQLLTLWKQELRSNVGILHIYDQTGHEVAGTTFLGDIWVEDE